MDVGRIARRAAVGGFAVAGGIALQQAAAGAAEEDAPAPDAGDTVTKTVRKAPVAARKAVSASPAVQTTTKSAVGTVTRTAPKAKAAVGTAAINTTVSNTVKTVTNKIPQASVAAYPGSEALFITITSPLPGTIVDPTKPLLVTGTVGSIAPKTNVYYVLDASESTGFPSHPCGLKFFPDCPDENGEIRGADAVGGAGFSPALSPCGDANSDGIFGSVFDCEVEGIVAINNALGTNEINATLITFWGDDLEDSENDEDPDIQVRDLSPGGGFDAQTLVYTDTDGDGISDVEEVVRNQVIVNDDEDDEGDGYEEVLQLLDDLIEPKAGERNLVFFFSDGVHEFEEFIFDIDFADIDNDGLTALNSLADKGVTIFSYSVGATFGEPIFNALDTASTAASGCGNGTALEEMADATGGTCTELLDPQDAPAVLAELPFGEIGFVGLEVNGVIFEITDIDEFGNWSLLIPPGTLRLGDNPIRAFVVSEDGSEFQEDFTNVIAVADLVAIQDFDDVDVDVDLVEGGLPVTGASSAGHLATTGLGALLAGGAFAATGRHRRRRRRAH